jgi:hypothetical protein
MSSQYLVERISLVPNQNESENDTPGEQENREPDGRPDDLEYDV